MKISSTLFMVAVLSILGAYYITVEKPFAEAGSLQPIKILNMTQGDYVSRLYIENRENRQRMTLKRENSSWSLEYPVSYPAENLLVGGMTAVLTSSYRLRRLPLKESEKKEYGLDSPKIKIGIETEKNPQTRHLIFGSKSPTGSGIFAQW